MDRETALSLKKTANRIRRGILRGVFAAKSGHPGGSLSGAELMTYLYFVEMKADPKNPKDPNRDRFVMSKGHAAPLLYAALAEKGYFPMEEMDSLRHVGAMLQGHPDMKHTPGVDMSTGSLGQGFSATCGMALAAKLQNKDYRVYAILGDGECEEGLVWEAAMFASNHGLDNLCIAVDYNGLQIDGTIKEVGGPEPLDAKFEAFGWHVIHADAHDLASIEAAYKEAKTVKGKPTAIIAKSVKGKCVSYMENQSGWHGKAPNQAEYDQAMSELAAQMAELEREGA